MLVEAGVGAVRGRVAERLRAKVKSTLLERHEACCREEAVPVVIMGLSVGYLRLRGSDIYMSIHTALIKLSKDVQ